MKFLYNDFECDIEVFIKENDYIFRVFDSKKEIAESEIHDLVIADAGYGFICAKMKGEDSGLISGYLDSRYFTSEDMVDSLLERIEEYVPDLKDRYVPYHIELVEFKKYVEYNGEY